MCTFLRKLMDQLDRDSPGWQENTTILLDNASWHTGPVMKERLARMQVPTIFSGPYSYSSSPIVSTEEIFTMFNLLTSIYSCRIWSSRHSNWAT